MKIWVEELPNQELNLYTGGILLFLNIPGPF